MGVSKFRLIGLAGALALFVLGLGFVGSIGPGLASSTQSGSEEPLIEDFETGDFSKLRWETGGDAPWIISKVSHGGTYVAQAGKIGDNGVSWLQVTLVVSEGSITFWYKTSSEPFDALRFYIDGEEMLKASGETDWQEVTYAVATGTHTFRWEYAKDHSKIGGQDTAWIDDIAFPPYFRYTVVVPERVLLVLPGQSIQGAIDVAENGSIILVSPGTYRENLVISKGLTIRGAGPDVVIESAIADKPVILIKGDQPVEVGLDSVKIAGASGRECWGGWTNPYICAHGILVDGQAKAAIQNSAISDNEVNGVAVIGSAQVMIRNTVISHNGYCGISAGFATRLDILASTIEDNYYGIYVQHGAQATIKDTSITNNDDLGVSISCYDDISRVTLQNNTISNNGRTGIYLFPMLGQGAILGNIIDGNGEHGIYVQGTHSYSEILVWNNVIRRNKGVGIKVYKGSRVNIGRNTIIYNNCGIHSDSPEDLIFCGGNEVHDNAQDYCGAAAQACR